jgi:sorbitol-specific phosphotransferase system component IIC
LGVTIIVINSTPLAIVGQTVDENTMGVYIGIVSGYVNMGFRLSNVIVNFIIGNIWTQFGSNIHWANGGQAMLGVYPFLL